MIAGLKTRPNPRIVLRDGGWFEGGGSENHRALDSRVGMFNYQRYEAKQWLKGMLEEIAGECQSLHQLKRRIEGLKPPTVLLFASIRVAHGGAIFLYDPNTSTAPNQYNTIGIIEGKQLLLLARRTHAERRKVHMQHKSVYHATWRSRLPNPSTSALE